jgi:hypothetical protein
LAEKVFDRASRVGDEPVTVHPASPPQLPRADAWHRVAALDAVNRWLHAPLDGSLIDAERGLARLDAARLLGEGPAREVVLREGASLAHTACYGVERYFQHLAGTVPDRLSRGLHQFLAGFQRLSDLEPDADDLHSVVRAGQRALETASRRQRRTSPAEEGPARGTRVAPAMWTSAIDPRQLPARVVELSEDPAMGEVLSRRAVVNGIPVLEVEVPAFSTLAESSTVWNAGERLMARFIDRLTGTVVARQLLTIESRARATGKGYAFRTKFPLETLDPARLRVDVVDTAIHLPPAKEDSDPRLLAARRDMVALREARAAAAAQGLGLVSRLAPDGESGRRPVATTGAARPLIAELALAHELASMPGS